MSTKPTKRAPRPLHLAEIRALAKRYTPEQLEACIQHQLRTDDNACEHDGSSEAIINVLAKAEYVRHLLAQGLSLPEALRELGRRMRRIQGS